MTDEELEIIGALAGCTFLPGHPHKRFVRNMHSKATVDPDADLTSRQREYLFGLRWMYRRQIADDAPGIAKGVAENHAYKRRKAEPKPEPVAEEDRQLAMF